jgi:hypothetical protein
MKRSYKRNAKQTLLFAVVHKKLFTVLFSKAFHGLILFLVST